MHTISYYKFGTHWYLDYPEYIEKGGDPDDLERFGYFQNFLDIAAAGETMVVFQVDTQPFKDADYFELAGSSGGITGGYYRLNHFEGKVVELELWFNTLIYYGYATLPQRIYFKKVNHQVDVRE
jgi:hypothetical protein